VKVSVPADSTREKLSQRAKEQWSDPTKRQRLLDARRKTPDTRELTLYCDDSRHLICTPYSVENLHRAARLLGIGKHWFHAGAKYSHYDIPKRRTQEIQAKCQVVSPREILSIVKGTW